jgi:hypothetical protein
MELNEEILERFLAGDCEQEEESFVLQALQEKPDLIDQYFQQHLPFLENQYNNKLPEGISDRLFNQIYTAIEEKKKRKSKLFFQIGSVAAFIVLAFGLWRIVGLNNQRSLGTPKVTETKIVKINKSDTLQNWELPDNSVVKASPGAVLSYSKTFNQIKSDVYLTGIA